MNKPLENRPKVAVKVNLKDLAFKFSTQVRLKALYNNKKQPYSYIECKRIVHVAVSNPRLMQSEGLVISSRLIT